MMVSSWVSDFLAQIFIMMKRQWFCRPYSARACMQFSEKEQSKSKRRQNIWKFGQKCTKFEKISKKSSLMRAAIARLKQLEYALLLLKQNLSRWEMYKGINYHWFYLSQTISLSWHFQLIFAFLLYSSSLQFK